MSQSHLFIQLSIYLFTYLSTYLLTHMIMSSSKTPKELPKTVRLDQAIAEYNRALLVYQNDSDPRAKKPNVQAIARYHGIISSTLGRRIAGQTHPQQEALAERQRLSPAEEQALETWILQVGEWGWPPRVSHVRFMASEMLKDKGDHEVLGKNWVAGFLHRHEELQSRFSQPLDKERAATHDPEKLLRWFQLFETTIQKYDIQQEDTYNMDEKGFALGVAGRAKVICSRDDLQVYVTQDGNREWTSLIECISGDGRLLDMFIIFKGKRHMTAWWNEIKGSNPQSQAQIGLSETGWTNNVLGLEWFLKYVSQISIQFSDKKAPLISALVCYAQSIANTHSTFI